MDSHSPFLKFVFADLAAQDLLKSNVVITALIQTSSKAQTNKQIWQDFATLHAANYAQIQQLDMVSYPGGVAHALRQKLPFEPDRTVLMHSHARLNNSSALRLLMETDYNLVSPLLSKQGKVGLGWT